MKSSRCLALASLLALAAASDVAMADRGRGGHGGHGGGHGGAHLGLFIGVPFGPLYAPAPYYPAPYYGPYAYPYPYYYPPVVQQPAPPVYLERPAPEPEMSPAPAPAPAATAYWYHCDEPEGYYPYVKECPGGWQKVIPHPPGQ